LPDPLGPMTPRLSPGASVKLTFLSSGGRDGANAYVRRSTSTLPLGAGSATLDSAGRSALRSLSRCQAPRASVIARQPLIKCSTGCNARDRMIVAAIMMPGDACMSMTSHAPSPSIAT
jgi:hypothetical protein